MVQPKPVVNELAEHVNETLEGNPLRAIFGAVYYRMAVEIQKFIDSDQCENPDLIRELDAVFAEQYFYACRTPSPPPPWMQAFHAENLDLTLVQHLLLGMNAHIIYDLPLALADAARSIHGLNEIRADYDRITNIFVELIPKVEETIGSYSKLIGCTHYFVRGADSSIFLRMIVRARSRAWKTARKLLSAGSMLEQDTLVYHMSFTSSQSAAVIADPGNGLVLPLQLFVDGLLWIIRKSEGNVPIADLARDLMIC